LSISLNFIPFGLDGIGEIIVTLYDLESSDAMSKDKLAETTGSGGNTQVTNKILHLLLTPNNSFNIIYI
jgi:hypothetical protein